MGKASLRIGTSGFQYDHWKGVFYPRTLSKHQWFGYYAQHFDTVEINNTFYRLPQAGAFDTWHRQAPPGFCYALKFSRYGTHLKRLKDPQEPIERFVSRAVHLKEFLGPILVQLPPHWGANVERLDAFLQLAPHAQRWAVEFRDVSWLCEAVFQVLERHNAALCIHDHFADHPRRQTADFVYLRFHGGATGDYSPQQLTAEARRIRGYLQAGTDVYAYFNNDVGGHAVHNAADLKRRVRVGLHSGARR